MKKLIVITGASSGIGATIAKTFADLGHPTLLLARRLEPMLELKLVNSMAMSVDVTDLKAVETAIRKAEQVYGPTDLLVNCAGVMLLGHSDTQSFSEWEHMLDVNIKGVLTGTHVVLHDMITAQRGTIINISSIAGRKTFDQHSVYCGSKFAVHAITEAMRKEVSASNVRFITIAPGVVETPLLSHTTDATIISDYTQWKQTIESGLDPQIVADCVRFAYQQPQSVCIREIVLAKTKQAD